MPSPRLSALEILTQAGLVPQQIALAQQQAGRDATSTQALTGAISGLVPQLANAGQQLSDKADADAMQSAQLAAAADVGGAGARDAAKSKVSIDPVNGPQANLAYIDDAKSLAQRRADAAGFKAPAPSGGFGDWVTGTLLGGNDRADKARAQFVASDVSNIAKSRGELQQQALEQLIHQQAFQDAQPARDEAKLKVAKDVLSNAPLPPTTTDLGPGDIARLNANPKDPALNAPMEAPEDQFVRENLPNLHNLAPELARQVAAGEFQRRSQGIADKAALLADKGTTADAEKRKIDEMVRHNIVTEGIDRQRANQPVREGNGGGDSGPGTDFDIRAQAIAANREPPPSLRDMNYTAIMGAVRRINPSYDPSRWKAYEHTRLEQATDKGIQASKAVRHHMDLLKTIVGEMPNDSMTDTPLLNQGAQWLAGGFGSDKYTALQTAARTVGEELSQAFGVGDAGGRAQVMHLVRPEQSKEQWNVSLAALEELRDEKLGVAAQTLGDLGPNALATPSPRGGLRAAALAMNQVGMSDAQIADALTKAGH